jgi:hypothetical protein
MIPCYTCLNSDLLLTLKPPNDCFLITNAKLTDWRNQKIHHRNQSSMTIFDSLLRFLSWCTWFTWGMFGWCPHRAASRHTFRTIFLAHILVRVRTCGMLQCDHSSVVHFCATAYQKSGEQIEHCTSGVPSVAVWCGEDASQTRPKSTCFGEGEVYISLIVACQVHCIIQMHWKLCCWRSMVTVTGGHRQIMRTLRGVPSAPPL